MNRNSQLKENTGWEISQDWQQAYYFIKKRNYVMDVYTVGKNAEQQRQHPCIDKKEKTIC